MPRPLIIKVNDHKPQSNKKATGSINLQLLQGSNKSFYEKYSFETGNASFVADFGSTNEEPANAPDEPRSIVRNLISRYESSTSSNANLTKYKSKSMVDLQKPPMVSMTPAPKTSQDDLLYNRHKYHGNDVTESQNQKFDFKTVFLKFETTNRSGTQINRSIQKSSSYTSDQLDLNDLKAKARMLLETRQGNLFWQDQVVEFLHQIGNLDLDTNHHQAMTESRPNGFEENSSTNERIKLLRAKSLDPAEFNKTLKVRDIKNIFDAKVADNDQVKSPPSRSVSSYAAYFGLKSDEASVGLEKKVLGARSNVPNNFDDYDYELESGDSEDSDLHQEGSYDLEQAGRMAMNDTEGEGNRVITQPVMASSARIRDLKNYFESDSDKYVPFDEFSQNQDLSDNSESENIHVVDNRMLPPPKVVVLDQESDFSGLEDSKQTIEELTKDIEDFEVRISELTVGRKDEGRYVNEVLVRILLKLDDVKTYGDEVVLRERRKAIEFVQNCIVKLKAKIHGRN